MFVIALLIVIAMAISREPDPVVCAPEWDGMALVYVETSERGMLTGCVYAAEVQGE